MPERIYEGPVQLWEPDEESRADIERLLTSTDELHRTYGEAYQNGCWIREWAGGNNADDEPGLTAVGDFNLLVELEFRTGTRIDQCELSLGECIELAFPGEGGTRVERVRDGVRQVLRARRLSGM